MITAPTQIPTDQPATRAASPEVTWLANLLPADRPRRIAQMHARGAAKYRDLATTQPLTPAMLAAHVAGRATYATTLDLHGLAQIGCMDVDEPTPARGRAVLGILLGALREAGLRAVATNVDNLSDPAAPHCGGHILVIYDGWQSAAAITAQLHQIAAAADHPAIEVWPSNQVIRLPFGYHQRARTFGTLITQDGETFTLDDAATRASAWAFVMDLACNAAPPALPTAAAPAPRSAPAPTALRVSPGEAGAARLSLDDARARFNAAHTLDDLLTGYGATPTKDGYTCCCGVPHTHETTLYISRQSKLFSFSPQCKLYTRYGWDAFGLFVKLDHGDDVTAALRSINPPPSPTRSHQEPPHSVETMEYTISPDEQARRAADAARKRHARSSDAAQIRAEIEARAGADTTLTDDDQLVLLTLIDAAQERTCTRWSVARIAEVLTPAVNPKKPGTYTRRVYTALAHLRDAGYITNTSQHGKTTWRTFVQMRSAPAGADVPTDAKSIAAHDAFASESEHDHESYAESGACERAPAPPAPSYIASSPASVAPQATRDCELRIVRADGRYQVADQHGAIHGTHASEDAAYAQIGTLYGALDAGALDDAAPLEGASYNPAEDCSRLDRAARTPLPLLPYERPALLRGFTYAPTGWTPPDAAADVPDVAAQHQLDAAPVAVAPVRTPQSKSAAYARKLAAMSDAEFNQERGKQTGFLLSRKFADQDWVKRNVEAIARERERRGGASAPAARGHTARGSQAPRIVRGRPGAAADVGVQNLRLFDDLALPLARSVAPIAAIAQ